MSHLVVGTAGHIDHGKSTLVHALTGMDPDRLKEEKARGITIDLGFAHWRRGDLTVAFVDVPGHERFVKNMLAGVGGIDAVLLVVAADEGVMPQTREHLDICRLLAVPRGVIAITKADLVDPEMLEIVQLDVAELVSATALSDSRVIPVSATTGLGVDALKDALASLATEVPHRDEQGAARLPVDRVFSMRGFGTVATGTLTNGRLGVDDVLEVTPGGRLVKVRGVQVHGARRQIAVAGERVAVNLAGVEVGDLVRGQVLATPGTLPTTSEIDAAIAVLPSARLLKHGARVRFHHGTAEILARVSTVGPAVDGAAPAIEAGGSGVARLRLEAPAALARGDRFVLRTYSPSITIAGGRVLDPAPSRLGVRASATRERLVRLNAPLDGDGSEEEALRIFVADAAARGVSEGDLLARAGAHSASGRQALERLRARADVWQVGDRVLLASWRPTLAGAVTAALAAHHDSQPLSDGLSREEVRERVLADAHPEVATAVLDLLAAAGTIRGRERLALEGRGVTLTAQESAAQSALASAYGDAGLTPPEADTLATRTGLSPAMIARVSQLLIRQQVLVRVDAFVFHRDALARLKVEVVALKAAGPARLDVAGFKDRYGLTRKYAIPLLEYLDRERVTRRVGDSRVVL
ncbi:MAG: selenocysteine-specific translation elongation factor [Vicinamibacteria bacterium]|nr:selenocysteine-specific translation elongation factor [Vicinamibacteria bacterium]